MIFRKKRVRFDVPENTCIDVPGVVDDFSSLEKEECEEQAIPDTENEVEKKTPEEHAEQTVTDKACQGELRHCPMVRQEDQHNCH